MMGPTQPEPADPTGVILYRTSLGSTSLATSGNGASVCRWEAGEGLPTEAVSRLTNLLLLHEDHPLIRVRDFVSHPEARLMVDLEPVEFTLAQVLSGEVWARPVAVLGALCELDRQMVELSGEAGGLPPLPAPEQVGFELAGEGLAAQDLVPRLLAPELLVAGDELGSEEGAGEQAGEGLLVRLSRWLREVPVCFGEGHRELADFLAEAGGEVNRAGSLHPLLAEVGINLGLSAETSVGLVREQNEDRYFTSLTVVGEPERLVGVILVCDGMGGHAAGEVAADLASRYMGAMLTTHALTFDARHDHRVEIQGYVDWVAEKLSSMAAERPELAGMGTTLSGGLVVEREGFGADGLVVNLGDSRTYLYSAGRLIRLTRDHDAASEMVARGEMSEEEARSSGYSSMLTRCLCAEPSNREVDVFSLTLGGGEALIAASDGLTDLVEDGVILRILAEAHSPDQAAELLVEEANRRGGFDNSTVLVLTLSWLVPEFAEGEEEEG